MSGPGRRTGGPAGARAAGALRTLGLLGLLGLGGPAPGSAQTILGRVLDDTRQSPVAGALVRLLAEDEEERASALADDQGRFTLVPPEAGRYLLEVVRLGYERLRSPLLEMRAGGDPVSLDLMLQPLPIGLEGLEVSVEAEADELLAPLGLSPAVLGNRWIDRAFIESVTVKPDIGAVIKWKGVPGAYVISSDQARGGSVPTLCVVLQRGRRGNGQDQCALVVLNGTPIRGVDAATLDGDAFEAVAVLLPTEAATVWGTMGSAGAVLLWTRRGEGR